MGQVRTNNIFINEECLNAGNGGFVQRAAQLDEVIERAIYMVKRARNYTDDVNLLNKE